VEHTGTVRAGADSGTWLINRFHLLLFFPDSSDDNDDIVMVWIHAPRDFRDTFCQEFEGDRALMKGRQDDIDWTLAGPGCM
jgi:hypothetical protein